MSQCHNPSQPGAGVRVVLGAKIVNPYPNPGPNPDQTRRVYPTRADPYWQALGVKPTLKYKDDLKIFRQPSISSTTIISDDYIPEYDYNREEALQRIAPLRVPWHKEKGDMEFHYQTTFIGYYLDLVLKHELE